MKGLRTAFGLAAILAMGGCGGTAIAPAPSAPVLNPALCRSAADCLQATGGIRTWQTLPPIRVKAVVTLYGKGQEAYVNQEELRIDLQAGVVEATAHTPSGDWQGRADAAGNVSLSGPGLPGDAKLRARLEEALVTTLHRYRGAINLLAGVEKPGAPSLANVDGVDVARVGVLGGPAGARAYYFAPGDRTLRYVTAGADSPGGKGTVTLYQYHKPARGLVLPREIRVVRIGQNVLVGRESDDLVMEAEFSAAAW